MGIEGLLVLLSSLVLVSSTASAHCPLCTGAIAAMAISAKFFGVDLILIGLLVGAFGVSTGAWFGKTLKKRFKIPVLLTIVLSFVLTVIPIFGMGDTTSLAINLFGELFVVDKMILGSVIGGVISLFAFKLHEFVKRVNGKVLFPFQGVVFTIGLLVLTGLTLIISLGLSLGGGV